MSGETKAGDESSVRSGRSLRRSARKSIRRMVKGISKRRSKSMNSSVATDKDAPSTTVSIDDRSLGLPAATESVSLQLVVLLMDTNTRRFELLQLDFDSDKARVSDIFAQIPGSVTEPVLRNQKYGGVMDESCVEQDETVILGSFCSGNKILVAVPKDFPVKECLRLARPILCDNQVLKMVSLLFILLFTKFFYSEIHFSFVHDLDPPTPAQQKRF